MNQDIKHNNSPYNEPDKDRIWHGVEKKIESYYSKRRFRNNLITATCILIICGLSIHLYKNNQKNILIDEMVSNHQNIIVPGSDKATLVTKEGKILDLNDLNSTQLQKEGVQVIHSDNGEVIYSVLPTNNQENDSYQTINTPRGGQTKILLPDGSIVKLNASSSLSFSNNLHIQNTREVVLKGEGYFDIKRNTKKPFLVKTDDQTVQVLGTQFNINSYDHSKTSITLIEGSVKINNRTLLKPGQQAIVHTATAEPIVKNVDVNDYIDWVNNQFVFRDENIKSIMIRLSRWYDFDVEYPTGLDESIVFNGEISRYEKVEEVLKLLSTTSSLKFEIKNKRIFVN